MFEKMTGILTGFLRFTKVRIYRNAEVAKFCFNPAYLVPEFCVHSFEAKMPVFNRCYEIIYSDFTVFVLFGMDAGRPAA